MSEMVDRAAGLATRRSAQLDVAFRAERARLVRRLTLIVGDPEEAEDLTQLTFLRAIEQMPADGDAEGLRRWLSVVAVRLAISERRRRKRWGFLSIRDEDREWAMNSDPDLWRAMRTLDDRTRAALVLTVLDGFTQDEVAIVFGVPRGTIASWLSRGRSRLRPILEEHP